MEEKLQDILYRLNGVEDALATVVREGASPEEIRAAADFIHQKVKSARSAAYEALERITASRIAMQEAIDNIEHARRCTF